MVLAPHSVFSNHYPSRRALSYHHMEGKVSILEFQTRTQITSLMIKLFKVWFCAMFGGACEIPMKSQPHHIRRYIAYAHCTTIHFHHSFFMKKLGSRRNLVSNLFIHLSKILVGTVIMPPTAPVSKLCMN